MQFEYILKENERPVIIIAAARSGTKLLREVLAQSSMFAEFQYDMNFIWLYGNYNKKHDELLKSDLAPEIKTFIRNRFKKLLKNSSATRVLEKSVPNSLRVEFVRDVFPEAQFIHLYRNGIDVSVDSMQCWQSSLFSQRIQKKSDLFKKVISFPYISAYPYLKDYLINYFMRLVSRDRAVQSWGPRYKGITEDIQRLSLIEVCGIQWSRSVHCALEQFSMMQNDKNVINVRYEKLVEDPKNELARICDFLNVPDADTVIKFGQKNISSDFVDFHKDLLKTEDMKILMPHIEPCLRRLSQIDG